VSVNETIPTQLCTLTVRATDEIRYVINDFAVGYRLGQWSLRKPTAAASTLGVYAGTPLHAISATRRASRPAWCTGYKRPAGDRHSQLGDPMIGIRWSVPMLEFDDARLRGDSAVGASSSSSGPGRRRAILASLDAFLAPTLPLAGYRVAAFDRSLEQRTRSAAVPRPTVGMGFTF